MNNLSKIFLTLIICISLPACSTIYQAKPGPTSTLVIDLPSSDHDFPTIYYYDESASTGKKVWDGARSLVYGFAGNIEQLNPRITISANKPFVFYYESNPDFDLTCSIKASFVPEANQIYRLKGGSEAPSASSKKSFIDALISNPDFGKCYVGVAKMGEGTMVPVKLKAY